MIRWHKVGWFVLGWALAAAAFNVDVFRRAPPALRCGEARDKAMMIAGAELYSCTLEKAQAMPTEDAITACLSDLGIRASGDETL